MNKPKVVIISTADWAGSQYHACQAINSAGEFECRHITMFRHPFEFPTDIFVSIYPNSTGERLTESVRASKNSQYSAACQALEESDVIHLWNTYPGEEKLMAIGLPIDFRKVKVITMTGSLYRDNFGENPQYHRLINQQIRELDGCRLTIQNPMLRFLDEIDSTFIPHAVDTDLLKPKEKREKIVATYKPVNVESSKSSDEELNLLRDMVKKYPDWRIGLDWSMTWKERIARLSECSLFVQDIKSHIGYWGRSALEACALGVSTICNFNKEKVDGLGSIPILNSDLEHIAGDLDSLLPDDMETRRIYLGEVSRKWIEDYFSYPVVGKMYSEVYRQVMNDD